MEDSLKRTLKALKEKEAWLSMLMGGGLVTLLIFIASYYGIKLFTQERLKTEDLKLNQVIDLTSAQRNESLISNLRQLPLYKTPTPELLFIDTSEEISRAIRGLTTTIKEKQRDNLETVWNNLTQKRDKFNEGKITETSIATTAAEMTENNKTEFVYTVIAGDNLWKIAERYSGSGFNYPKIALHNGLSNPALIRPGERLLIPFLEAAETLIPDESLNSVVVKKGDSLWAIAERVYNDGSRYPEIVKANISTVKVPSVIEPGWVLVIPRT